MQQTVLVALVTGVLTATAALTASWLSSRSTIRAAELNIRFGSARARHEQRRTAYVDLLTSVTEIRWRTRDLAARAGAGDTTAVNDYRAWRGIAGNELARRRYVVELEGPDEVQKSVRQLNLAIDRFADDLDAALQLSGPEVRAAIRDSRAAVGRASQSFLETARAALEAAESPEPFSAP